MLMQEVRKLNYDVFQECESAPRRKELASALAYADQLSAITSSDISDWHPLEVFKNSGSEKGFIYSDKNKINELFFAELEKRKSVVVHSDALRPEQRAKLSAVFSQGAKQERQKLIHSRDSAQGQAADHYNAYVRHMLEWQRCEDALYLPSAYVEKQLTQIEDALKDDFWELGSDIGSSYVRFLTKPIILRHVNKAQAIDMTVPMGRFMIDVNFGNMLVNASPMNDRKHPNVTGARGHFHPHIGGDSKVCFGNMQNDLNKALIDRDFKRCLHYTKAALTNYNVDSPYVRLDVYRDAVAERARHEQAVKEAAEAEKDAARTAKNRAKRAKKDEPDAVVDSPLSGPIFSDESANETAERFRRMLRDEQRERLDRVLGNFDPGPPPFAPTTPTGNASGESR